MAFAKILSVEPTADEQATMTELLQRMTELAKAKNRPNPETVRDDVSMSIDRRPPAINTSGMYYKNQIVRLSGRADLS